MFTVDSASFVFTVDSTSFVFTVDSASARSRDARGLGTVAASAVR